MNPNNNSSSVRRRWALRYGLAFVAVAAGFGLRVALTVWIGPGLPTYITFYPVVMVVALLAGFGPGLLATALTALVTAYWILPPGGQFVIASPVDRVGLVLFTGMGLFMSVVAEFYRRNRRKAAAYDQEKALRESEERLNFALETSHTGAWDLDLVDHTAFRSIEHDRIFGYAELLPKWTYEMFLEHVLPEDRAMVDGKFRRAMETRGDWNFECRIRRTDGQVRWIWGAGRHRLDAAGTVRRMAGIVQDITERKEVEEALRESEERHQLATSVAKEAIWEVNLQTGSVRWNHAYAELFGRRRMPRPTVPGGLAAFIRKTVNAWILHSPRCWPKAATRGRATIA